MKRSEAVSKIAAFIDMNKSRQPENVAPELLVMIETELGMLPPLRNIKVEAPATTWYYDGNEWEYEV